MTALELEIRVYHRMVDDASGPWTGTRIRKLCNLLKLSTEEFAALIRITPGQMEKYCIKERWPGCLLTVLNLVERSAHRKYLGTTYEKSVLPYQL